MDTGKHLAVIFWRTVLRDLRGVDGRPLFINDRTRSLTEYVHNRNRIVT
jgi:hypothetical protein